MIGNGDDNRSNAPLAPSAGERDEANELLSALADPLRRRALHALSRAGGNASLTDLVDRIARTTDGRSRDRLAIELHHRHLPKLAESGLVEYDHRSNAVAATERGRRESVVAVAALADR